MTKSERTTIDFLHKMEIPPSLKGYRYIIAGVEMMLDDENLIYALVSTFYPAIGKKFNASDGMAERNIRHAIECANPDAVKTLLHLPLGKTRNGSFLAALAEAVRMQLDAEGST